MLEYNPYEREQITFHCQITLRSGLSHIGETLGNVSNLKTSKLIDPEGKVRSVFVYSGNALRNGVLRRVGIASTLSTLGLTVTPDVHHTLFAGGRIDGATTSDMDLDYKIRQLLPWLSVLGTAKPCGVFGSKNSQMVHGRLAVGAAWLVCYETALLIYRSAPGLLPPESIPLLAELEQELNKRTPMQPNLELAQVRSRIASQLRQLLPSWTQLIVVDQTVRQDSLHSPALKPFVTQPEGQLLLAGETTKEKKSDQMIASDRLIVAGATLYSRWDASCTKVELGWIANALLEFAKAPYLGGKRARGHGLVNLQLWYQTPQNFGLWIDTATEETAPHAKECLSAYWSYLQAYQQFLEEVNQTELRRFLCG